MSQGMRYVICYDIADGKRRRKVAECLEGYGDRVQESIFEAVLGRPLFERCIEELAAIMDNREDRVAAYRIYANCESARRYLGVKPDEDIGREDVFVV